MISFANRQNLNVIDNPYDCRFLAASYFRLGSYADALTLLQELSSVYGEDPGHISLLASTYRRLGQFEQASVYFKRALSLDPQSLSIKNNYANLLIDLKKYDLALEMLDGILQLSPDYVDAVENRKRLLSIKTLNEASIEDRPQFDPLSLAFAPDEVAGARSRYMQPDKSRSDATGFPSPPLSEIQSDQLLLLEKALQEGQCDFALNICSDIYKHHGISSFLFEKCSEAFIQKDRFKDAEIFLLQSIVLGGSSQKHFVNLVSLAMMRNDLNLAQYYLEKAVEFDPNSSFVTQLKSQLNSKKAVSTSFQFS